MSLMNDALITRAREYIKDKYLDVADVPLFIERLVKLHDEHVKAFRTAKAKGVDHLFDFSDM